MEEMQNRNQLPVESDQFSDFADKFDKTLTLEESSSSTARRAENGDETLISRTTAHEIDNEEEDEDENEEFEFCFFGETIKSPVSAEEVFEDGQIRIIAPFSGEGEAASTTSYRPPVKNYFVVSNSPENDDVAEGAYCVWKSPTPEMSKKSNSTGFSKFRKMRDLLARSNSDGKDAFVFLNGKNEETTLLKKEKKKEKVKLEKLDVGKKKKEKEGETAAFGGERKEKEKKKKSAYEVLYGGEKKKGGGKSYLPYRQDLVGFFTNGSGMSRNVHPY